MLRELTEEDTDFGTLYDVDEFVGLCISEDIVDSDGYGRLVYDEEVDGSIELAPSDYDSIPENVTYILWFKC